MVKTRSTTTERNQRRDKRFIEKNKRSLRKKVAEKKKKNKRHSKQNKFKDKRLWNLDEQFQWSSQPINSMASIVWSDDGTGKTVKAALTSYVSNLGYDFKVYTADEHFVSATFAANAFENSNFYL